jgi:hypothetical protein
MEGERKDAFDVSGMTEGSGRERVLVCTLCIRVYLLG